jgi:pimeloyl-ACP methyl ester carboxylesterase
MLTFVDLAIESARPAGNTRLHPLLFVHGAWHGAWCWERFLPWFAARGWESHAVDLRGHGRSPIRGSRRTIRIHDLISDLGEAVDSLDRPPILVAHSMGGLVAQRFLEDREAPGAVLLAPVPLGGVTRTTLVTAARHPLRFLQATLTLDLGALVKDRKTAADLLLPADTDPIEIDSIWSRLRGDSYLAYLDMLFTVRPRPPLVSTPVVIVAGTADRIFTVAAQQRTARAYGTELVVIEGGAHDLMLGPRWQAAATAVEAAASAF